MKKDAKNGKIGKFYKHDIQKSIRENNERHQRAQTVRTIPILAEQQILHLIDVSENGLPDCYSSFDEFLSDFWPDFSWTPKGSELEIKAVLVDSRFEKIVPVLNETWNIDIEEILQEGLKVITSDSI